MSLLDEDEDRYEDVLVYPEETYISRDGNVMTRASSTGVPTKARWQIQGQSGTSSRRAEQQEEGFESERVYTIRFPRDFQILGAQAQVRRGLSEADPPAGDPVYSIFGDVQIYKGSRRTAHVDYTVRRA